MILDLYSLSGMASYRKISGSLKVASLDVIIVYLCNLVGVCQMAERLENVRPFLMNIGPGNIVEHPLRNACL